MNKNFKILQIHGLIGLLFIGIVLVGLFSGFVLFPIWAIMTGWNEIVTSIHGGPSINYCQASLLWTFTVICFYLVLKNSISIKFHNSETLDEEINDN